MKPTPSRCRPAIKAAGSLVGVAVALAVLLPGRMPAPVADAPVASVTVNTVRTGQLLAVPTGELLAADVRPGTGAAEGTLTVVNRTGRSLDVRLTAQPSNGDLDHLLWVRVGLADRELFDGPLRALRRGTTPVYLGTQAQREFTFEVWLPASVTTGYEYRSVQVDLHYSATLRTA